MVRQKITNNPMNILNAECAMCTSCGVFYASSNFANYGPENRYANLAGTIYGHMNLLYYSQSLLLQCIGKTWQSI